MILLVTEDYLEHLPLCSLGQQRSRMLATLFKDERCQQLAAYGILEKMYLDRIIRGNQLQEFAAMLMPHQKATTADGNGHAFYVCGWGF